MLGRKAAVIGREAANRAKKSREVDLSRLKGFHLRFAPKMRSGVTCRCLRLHLEVRKVSVSLRPKQSNVYAFLLARKSKFAYFVLKRLGAKKKTKACLNLELITGKEVSSGEIAQTKTKL